eukprot:GILJ01005451.1.p1 GENE.GILJ01005451.1~~GILJ01005451.1.p1  ORF type:complete len:466 (-),score=59.67 GILJ01005451.1:202-1599(-)
MTPQSLPSSKRQSSSQELLGDLQILDFLKRRVGESNAQYNDMSDQSHRIHFTQAAEHNAWRGWQSWLDVFKSLNQDWVHQRRGSKASGGGSELRRSASVLSSDARDHNRFTIERAGDSQVFSRTLLLAEAILGIYCLASTVTRLRQQRAAFLFRKLQQRAQAHQYRMSQAKVMMSALKRFRSRVVRDVVQMWTDFATRRHYFQRQRSVAISRVCSLHTVRLLQIKRIKWSRWMRFSNQINSRASSLQKALSLSQKFLSRRWFHQWRSSIQTSILARFSNVVSAQQEVITDLRLNASAMILQTLFASKRTSYMWVALFRLHQHGSTQLVSSLHHRFKSAADKLGRRLKVHQQRFHVFAGQAWERNLEEMEASLEDAVDATLNQVEEDLIGVAPAKAGSVPVTPVHLRFGRTSSSSSLRNVDSYSMSTASPTQSNSVPEESSISGSPNNRFRSRVNSTAPYSTFWER